MNYFVSHNNICIYERLIAYLVPCQRCLQGGPWIGSLHLKPADLSVSSSSTANRVMVVAIARNNGEEKCHEFNFKSLNVILLKYITYKLCYFI